MGVAPILVILPDHHQPGVFALRAGVRLQRHRREAGDLTQHPFELGEDRLIARRLIDRRERVQLAELRPGNRQHLGSRVQLHRA